MLPTFSNFDLYSNIYKKLYYNCITKIFKMFFKKIIITIMWSLLQWETLINIFKHVNKLNSSYSINLSKYEVGWQ